MPPVSNARVSAAVLAVVGVLTDHGRRDPGASGNIVITARPTGYGDPRITVRVR